MRCLQCCHAVLFPTSCLIYAFISCRSRSCFASNKEMWWIYWQCGAEQRGRAETRVMILHWLQLMFSLYSGCLCLLLIYTLYGILFYFFICFAAFLFYNQNVFFTVLSLVSPKVIESSISIHKYIINLKKENRNYIIHTSTQLQKHAHNNKNSLNNITYSSLFICDVVIQCCHNLKCFYEE